MCLVHEFFKFLILLQILSEVSSFERTNIAYPSVPAYSPPVKPSVDCNTLKDNLFW